MTYWVVPPAFKRELRPNKLSLTVHSIGAVGGLTHCGCPQASKLSWTSANTVRPSRPLHANWLSHAFQTSKFHLSAFTGCSMESQIEHPQGLRVASLNFASDWLMEPMKKLKTIRPYSLHLAVYITRKNNLVTLPLVAKWKAWSTREDQSFWRYALLEEWKGKRVPDHLQRMPKLKNVLHMWPVLWSKGSAMGMDTASTKCESLSFQLPVTGYTRWAGLKLSRIHTTFRSCCIRPAF